MLKCRPALGLLVAALTAESAQARPTTLTLLRGTPHVLRVEAQAGQIVTAEIDQGETDLTVTIVGPEGGQVAFRDAREHGAEPVAFLAERQGTYRIEVRSVDPVRGRISFRAQVDAPRARASGDDQRLRAEEQSTEARQLYRKGTREALREAAALRQRVLPLWRALDHAEMVRSTLLGIGDAFYRLSQYDDARPSFLEALELSAAPGAVRDRAEALNNLGLTAWRKAELSAARQYLEDALPLWDAVPYPRGKALTSNNLGIMLRQAGEYDAARQAYRRAIDIARSIGDQRTMALALSNMGVVLDALGRPREAIAHFRRAAALFGRIPDSLGHVPDVNSQGRALLAQARTEASTMPAVALSHAREATRLIGKTPDRVSTADALLLTARLLDTAGRHAEAAEGYDKARSIFRDIGNQRGEADLLHALALSRSASDTRAALQMFQEALAIRQRIRLRGQQAETHYEIARLQRGLGDLENAQRSMEAAIAIVEDIQGLVFERELRTSYLGAITRHFSEYVSLLLARHALDREGGFGILAFQAADRARSRVLIERHRERLAVSSPNVAPATLERYRELGRAVAYWSQQVAQQAEGAAAETQSAANRALESAIESRRQAEADIRRGDPRYRALMQPATIAVDDIRRALDDRTVLVRYFLSDRQSYAWTLSAAGVDVIELAGRREIETRARRFRTLVSRNPEVSRDAAADKQREIDRRRLSRLLVEPIAAALRGRQRVVIVPDGELHVLPFGALQAPARAAALVETYEIVISPSAGLLALLSQEQRLREPAPRTVAAIGNPVFSAWDNRVVDRSRPGTPAGGRRFGRLPSTEGEVAHIAGLRPLDSLEVRDFEANKPAVLRELPNYRFIHFATHAYDDDHHPELSGIVLSLVNRRGEAQDGIIRVDDVYGLRLRAELVVLSACETAVGPPQAGEGVGSLSRAFLYGGALRVLATLWPVTDRAASAMMRHYYTALLERGESPSAALRSAQAAMRADPRWTDDFYWAGFVVQGIP